MRKKAQIQMMETIAVLLIFFILIVLGIIFYGRVMKGNLEQEKEEQLQLQAIKVAQRASFLPELQCSQDNIVSENCIDLLKLNAAAIVMDKQANEIFYYDRFLFSKITVNEIYPDARQWTLYDRPLSDFTSKIITNVPISLYEPVEDSYKFGVMNIEYYSAK